MKKHTGVSMNYINIWYNTPLIYRKNIMKWEKSSGLIKGNTRGW